MSDAAILTLVTGGLGAVSTVMAATLPVLLRGRRDIKHVKDQVTNSHATNLRDDITAIGERVDLVLLDTSWMRREQHDLTQRVIRLEERS